MAVPGFSVVLENAHSDGSYVATVKVYGVEFAAHYIKGEVRVGRIGGAKMGHSHGWRFKKYPALAKVGVEERIAALGPEFAAAHVELYKEEA